MDIIRKVARKKDTAKYTGFRALSHQILSLRPFFGRGAFSYAFSGMSDICKFFMKDMAGAAEIQAAKLFGRSPRGMHC